MLKIKVELPFSWVLKNRNDNVLPIEAFKNYILEKFEKDYEVTSSNLTEIYIYFSQFPFIPLLSIINYITIGLYIYSQH